LAPKGEIERKRAEAEIHVARDTAERALQELQAAQASLLHAQKMAATRAAASKPVPFWSQSTSGSPKALIPQTSKRQRHCSTSCLTPLSPFAQRRSRNWLG